MKTVKEFDNIASKTPSGSEGIITLPFFKGDRTPNLPGGKGYIAGMDMTNTERKNIFRSSLKSAILGMRLSRYPEPLKPMPAVFLWLKHIPFSFGSNRNCIRVLSFVSIMNNRS